MKKSLLALAAMSAVGVASAQSSVTWFGVVDLAARSAKNSTATVKTLATDGNASSRFGWRGVEDLGGGMRAGFWVEAGYAPDCGCTSTTANANVNKVGAVNTTNTTGAPLTPATLNLSTTSLSTSQIFGRRSTLSLMGGFGELRLGRDYTPSFWNHTVFDVFGTNGLGSTLNISKIGSAGGIFNGAAASATTTFGYGTGVRANNSIGYFLPAMGGLYGQVMWAAGEKLEYASNKYTGLRLGYAAGPLNVAFATGTSPKDNVVGMVDSAKDTNFGISFNAGFATFYGQWMKLKYNTEAQKGLYFAAGVPVGAGTIKFSYTKNTTDSTASTTLTKQYDATQMALGYVHDLSKRTALYAHYARISNGGTSTSGANFTFNGASGAQTRGDGSSGYEFGIRHSF